MSKPHTTRKGSQYEGTVPTTRDRVVQAALLTVLEPILEADFLPCSYGFRPNRRAHDAIAEVHMLATQGYVQVFEGDIEACFDHIDHTALMGRLRRRVGDKRVLALVKAFLKAGILGEDQVSRDTRTGTPQGGILTPPTQLAIGPCFALRVGFGAGVGAVGGVASDRDGVSDRDLVGADEDVFDEQAQDSLAFFDGRSAGLGAQSGEEAFEVVGEFEVDLPVGELAVEGVDLLAQAGLSGPQLRHPGTEFVEGDQLFLEGADESGDRRGRLGQSGVETLALGGGGVRGADLLESLVDLGPDQGRVGEQAADVVPDDGVEVVGADRLVGADPAVLIAVVIRAEAAVVVDLLVGGADTPTTARRPA